jgi:hypothetical protein
VTLDNLLVQSVFERRRTDAAWGRLLRALRAARNPAAPALPAREQLCARRGLRLESGPPGTCKRGPQLVAIRTREMGLRLPGIAIDGVRVRRGPRFAVSDGLVVGHLRLAGPVDRLRVRPEPEPEPLPPPEPPPEPEPPLDPRIEPASA